MVDDWFLKMRQRYYRPIFFGTRGQTYTRDYLKLHPNAPFETIYKAYQKEMFQFAFRLNQIEWVNELTNKDLAEIRQYMLETYNSYHSARRKMGGKMLSEKVLRAMGAKRKKGGDK